jgi:hypothetical protein
MLETVQLATSPAVELALQPLNVINASLDSTGILHLPHQLAHNAQLDALTALQLLAASYAQLDTSSSPLVYAHHAQLAAQLAQGQDLTAQPASQVST